MNLTELHEAQLAYWGGDSGKRWADHQRYLDQMIEPMGDALLAANAPQPGERVLDIGCGCGASALQTADLVGADGVVLGVDISPDMLQAARRRLGERTLTNTSFELSDVATRPFEPEWDLVMSRFGVMFFGDPLAAFRNIRLALRASGRLGFICWRAATENEWVAVLLTAAADIIDMPPPPHPHAPGPFAFADPDRVNDILSAAGFQHIVMTPVDRQMTMRFDGPDPLARAAEFVIEFGPLGRLLSKADDATRQRVKAHLPVRLSDFERHGAIQMGGAAWIVSATL